MKKYIIFAGVNGAGKSTLYMTNPVIENMPRVNVDEIVRSIGDWRNIHDVAKAGKMAVAKLEECFRNGVPVNQETTLCGKGINEPKKIYKPKGCPLCSHTGYLGRTGVFEILPIDSRVRDIIKSNKNYCKFKTSENGNT